MQTPLEGIEQFAIEVILERRYGKRATLFRWLLHLISWGYRLVMRVRLFLYDNNLPQVQSLGTLVISVGNLTVGGTGKTPIVELLAKTLSQNGRQVAILSRGYKSVPEPMYLRFLRFFVPWFPERPPRVVSDGIKCRIDSTHAGDEPFMLAKNLKNVVVMVDKDRVKSGNFAIKNFDINTILLDDGFQYLKLKDRIDIVLVDRETPFGNEYLLPRGMLREPHHQMKRANLICITKCNHGDDLSELKARLRRLNSHAPIIESKHSPCYLENVTTGEQLPLEFLKELSIGTISGIAKPESFHKGLKSLGAKILYHREYADHHRYSKTEVLKLIKKSRVRGATAILTTEKDAVRFPQIYTPDLPIYFLRVEIEILGKGMDTIIKMIDSICTPPSPQKMKHLESSLALMP